VMHIKDVVVQR